MGLSQHNNMAVAANFSGIAARGFVAPPGMSRVAMHSSRKLTSEALMACERARRTRGFPR